MLSRPEKSVALPLPGIETRFLSHPASNPSLYIKVANIVFGILEVMLSFSGCTGFEI
jgi:hypothetical protein